MSAVRNLRQSLEPLKKFRDDAIRKSNTFPLKEKKPDAINIGDGIAGEIVRLQRSPAPIGKMHFP